MPESYPEPIPPVPDHDPSFTSYIGAGSSAYEKLADLRLPGEGDPPPAGAGNTEDVWVSQTRELPVYPRTEDVVRDGLARLARAERFGHHFPPAPRSRDSMFSPSVVGPAERQTMDNRLARLEARISSERHTAGQSDDAVPEESIRLSGLRLRDSGVGLDEHVPGSQQEAMQPPTAEQASALQGAVDSLQSKEGVDLDVLERILRGLRDL